MKYSQVHSVFFKLYLLLPKKLRRSFWYTSTLSVGMGVVELALAATVSLLGVALVSPDAFLNIVAVQKLAQIFPRAELIWGEQRSLITALLICIVCIVAVKQIFNAAQVWTQEYLGQRVSVFFFDKMFRHYLHAPYLWFACQDISKISTHLYWANSTAVFLTQGLVVLTQICIGCILFFGVLLAAPHVGLIVLFSLIGLAGMIYPLSKKIVIHFSRRLSNYDKSLNRLTYTALQGMREVLIYRKQKYFEKAVGEELLSRAHIQASLAVSYPFAPWMLEIGGMGTLLVAVLYMNWTNSSLTVFIGTITLLAGVAWRLMPTANRMMGALMAMQGTISYINPMLCQLEEVAEFLPPKQELSPPMFKKSLDFANVSFRYPATSSDKGDALRQVDLSVKRGKMLGIIGPSGAGKSTLVGLMTGLFSPTQGKLLLDGSCVTPELAVAWRSCIGYVPQAPFLLNASIAKNIAFGDSEESIDHNRVLDCCRMAAMTFLDDLPEGIETVIGERGVRLSGGQVQRVSIARALYNNPQMLLFDEATSALDGAAEQAIQHTISKLRERVTIVVVAHRLSTVEACDYLYWIDDGMVKMQGTPKTVLPIYNDYLNDSAMKMVSHTNMYT